MAWSEDVGRTGIAQGFVCRVVLPAAAGMWGAAGARGAADGAGAMVCGPARPQARKMLNQSTGCMLKCRGPSEQRPPARVAYAAAATAPQLLLRPPRLPRRRSARMCAMAAEVARLRVGYSNRLD